MRFIIVFLKTCRELTRDWLTTSLTLVFAPFFVFAYWLWTSGGSTSYNVLVLNEDRGAVLADGSSLFAGEEAIRAIQTVQYADGKPLLKVIRVTDRQEVEKTLRNRGAAAFIQFDQDFSRTLLALQSGDASVSARITFGGDLTNPYYTIGSVLSLGAVESYIQQFTGMKPVLQYVEQPLGASAARTEFENYTPGVIIFSVIMLIFPAAMIVAREVEAGTLRRLQITRMRALDLLGGTTAALVLVGIISVLITFATAVALGFHSQGPIWVAMLIGAVTSLSVVGLGMITACFSKTVSQAFVIANFPLGVLMFFSGVIFPFPLPTLFTMAGHSIGLDDFLPPTHAVVALNKILTLGAGFQDVIFELAALLTLSLFYLGVGVWLFQRMHMK
ncbi:MAG: ABC transporter permease [Anaerolineales bacterium]|nr:ABC transporter permease [Anaerolineales bacterium]